MEQQRVPGELRPGDIVQLTDPKGHPHTITLEPGKTFHTHRGGLAHNDIMAAGEGSVVSRFRHPLRRTAVPAGGLHPGDAPRGPRWSIPRIGADRGA